MPETIQRSFTGGEISPSLRARADLNKYTNGLALCRNMFVKPQGGVYSRQGLRFIAEADNSADTVKLIPFSFNTDQTYILVFNNSSIRFITNGGYVLENDNVTVYEVSTPYTASDLESISFTQRADVMTIVHPNHRPRNLSRTADNDWSLDIVNFSPTIQPPNFVADSTVGITTIAAGNPTVVTTAPAHGLNTGQTIALINLTGGLASLNDKTFLIERVTATTFNLIDTDTTGLSNATGGSVIRQDISVYGSGAGDFDKNYKYVITSVNSDGEESLPSTSVEITTASLSQTAAVRLMWEPVVDAVSYNIYKDPSENTGLYGFIGTSSNLSFSDFNLAPITSQAPPNPRDIFTRKTGSISDLENVSGTVTITSAGHGLNTAEEITISGVVQPADINGGPYAVRIIDDDSFAIDGVVGVLDPYTFGGTFLKDSQNPSTVNYYQQRQVYANTMDNRQTVFTTQTGNFNSLRTSIPSRADDAITFSIAGREVNEIRHIVELDAMILMTSGGVWRITEGQDQVLTPATIGVKKQSNKGSSRVQPIIVDETVIYVQDKNSRVRDLNYEFSSDKFRGNDLSVMSQHFFEGFNIVDMAYSDEPYGILWMVRDDGALLGLTYQREQQVWAWHQHVTDGNFESIAVIDEDGRDAVYVCVNRTIGGQQRRYIERFEPRNYSNIEDTFSVDSGLIYSGPPATSISGLSHLEGKDVVALADGNKVSGLTVSGGLIELPNPASKVIVGLPYEYEINTLDLDVGALQETLKAKTVSVAKVVVEFEDTRGALAGAVLDDGSIQFREFKPRTEEDGYGVMPLRTFKDEIILEPTLNRSGAISIKGESPLPIGVLAVVPAVDIS